MNPSRTHRPSPFGALVGVAALGLCAGVAAWLLLAGDTPQQPGTDASLCTAYSGLPEGWPEAPRAGMVSLPGSAGFQPGNAAGYPDEAPRTAVDIAPFWIDRTEVTNAQFAAFVAATGYVTEAERTGEAVVFRGLNPSQRGQPWWHMVAGASWQHPEGPDSDIAARLNHPVVHVTYADALAYARWLGRDLPTEAEWEYAARAGGQGKGLDRQPRDDAGRPQANFWQGEFPFVNDAEDGHTRRAPVGCFAANGYGLHDMVGNVWEWTRDRYTPANSGPATRVIKGGSFLCAENFCRRYRSTSRHSQEEDLPIAHLGFRTVSR